MGKRLTVYPQPRALVVLGRSAPALNLALECWARVIAEATDRVQLSPKEWNYLADCHSSHYFDSLDGPTTLAMQVRDAEKCEGLGEKWNVDVEALAKVVENLSFEEAWASIAAVQFYWDAHGELSEDDEWWTIRVRHEVRSEQE